MNKREQRKRLIEAMQTNNIVILLQLYTYENFLNVLVSTFYTYWTPKC